MRNFLKILLQYLAPQHAYTRFFKKLCNCRWSWLKKWMIHTFIRRYKVDMSAAQIEDPDAYPTFNLFFTRHIKPELRPIIQGTNTIACPVDGQISQIGKIDNDRLFQAKGFYYSLTTLLGGNIADTAAFKNGNFATLYLSPKDYHRIHMPISGHLQKTIYVPGALFSVNPLTTSMVPNLFSRNERLICLFETEIGPIAVILVGAMIVGSIHTSWDDHPRTKNITQKLYTDTYLNKGDELGYFELGSTVILLFGENKMEWQSHLLPTQNIVMGEQIGTLFF